MKKKFLALVLTLAMVLSLVPATALAAGDESTRVGTVQSDGNNGVKVIKTATATPGDNGKATIDMEAYVTGTVTSTTQSTPLDIVLVLDQSGSMEGSNLQGLKTAATKFINTITEDANRHKVNHRIAVVGFADSDYNTELFVGATQYGYGRSADGKYKDAFQTVTDETGKSNLTQSINNLDAEGGTHPELGMKMANNIFGTNSDESGTRQRIVVMFTDGSPGDYIWMFDYDVADATVAEAYTTKNTYHATVYTVGLISNPSDQVKNFLNKVSSNYLDAKSYAGKIDVYTEQYNVNKDKKYYVKKADGSYTKVKYYSTKKSWRDSLNGTTYVPKNSADDTDTSHTQFYSLTKKDPEKIATKYYMHTGNADELNKIFSNIAQDTTHARVEVNATSEMRDELSKFFVFDGITHDKNGVVTSGVAVTKVAAQGNSDTPEWATTGTDITNAVTVKVVGDKITVTGFDYSSADNCVVKKTGTGWKGYKLVLSFNVTPNVNCYDWKEEKNYDTNKTTEGSQAGLYYGDSGSTVLNESPQVPVPTYQVIYDWGTSGVTTPVTDSRYYISGQKATVDYTTVQKETAVQGNNDKLYRFRGWSENGTDVVDKVGITNRNVTLTPVLTEAYTVTYTDGVENEEVFADQVYSNLISGDATPRFNGAPTREGYRFTGWEPTVAENVTGNAVYTAQWEKEEVLYTLIFDANGGAWSGTTVDGYTVSEGKASRSGVPGTEKITSTSITAPTNQGKVLDGWGYYDDQTLTKISNLDLPSSFAPTVEQLYNEYGQKPTNTVTLYAIWKDDTTSADSLTYTIKQHYIRSEQDADHVEIKDLSNEQGIKISDLIKDKAKDLEWRDGHGSLNHYAYVASETTVTVPNQPAQPYNKNDTLSATGTVIDLYYYLDDWKDADQTSDEEDEDSATGGDGTPDYKQILIQYQVYQKDNGLVTPEFEVVTVKNGNELTAIHGSSVTKAGTGYTFVTWTGRNVAVTEKTVGDIIKETSAEKLKKEKCDLSKDTFEQGKSYTYTAIFLEDKIGGGDNKDQPDGIPDRYQVTINYVSSDTSKGSVGTLTKEVLTIYENGKEGKWASKGKVVASGSTATATGNRCYFVNWTKQQEGSTASSTVTSSANLPAQTIENAKGGDVYTFTANFDRSSGSGSGGSNRPKPPVVEIPDDVPTGLNGKDHYAYVVGYPDGMVYPQKNITRAEVATIFFRLLTDETREANMTKSNSYNDMKDGAWYTCAVSTLSKMGIIKGYEDGSFKPDASISRAEFAAIAARFDPDGDKTPATFSDVSSHWAKDEISIAANHGWIKGYEDGSFKPDQKITRAETMTLVNRVLKRLPETKDDLHKDMKTWPDNQKESAWFYLAVQEATNSHYQKLKKDGTHETWESMRETRDWAALEK